MKTEICLNIHNENENIVTANVNSNSHLLSCYYAKYYTYSLNPSIGWKESEGVEGPKEDNTLQAT